jgi:hypothetical protein
MADVFLKYVGKKPWAFDSLSGTGVQWNGNGDIQPIDEAAAEKLLRHPDQWALVPLKEALARVQEAEPFDDELPGAKPKARAKK